VKIDTSLVDRKLEPRLNQIMLPVLSIIGDPNLRAELRHVALSAQASIAAERGLLMEAQVLEILAELISTSGRPVVPVADTTAGLIDRYGAEYERSITNRWIGSILRKKLNLQTYKSHGSMLYLSPSGRRSSYCAGGMV
jgi:hypothetical protein